MKFTMGNSILGRNVDHLHSEHFVCLWSFCSGLIPWHGSLYISMGSHLWMSNYSYISVPDCFCLGKPCSVAFHLGQDFMLMPMYPLSWFQCNIRSRSWISEKGVSLVYCQNIYSNGAGSQILTTLDLTLPLQSIYIYTISLNGGFICIKVWGSLCWSYLIFLKYSMKMK